jgi:hypothetical protein
VFSERKEKEGLIFLEGYIFFLSNIALKVLPQHSQSPIVNSVLFPALSGLPASFHVFLGSEPFRVRGRQPHFCLFLPVKIFVPIL